MDWKKYWNDNASLNSNNEINQVQRKDIKSTLMTANRIIRILDINCTDKVLDVCCGNGIVTQRIAKKANFVEGVDQSEILIDVAKNKHNELNILYHVGNCINLSSVIENKLFDKIYLQFSFQYFDKKNEGKCVIAEMLKCLKPNGQIFIGDVPNMDKFPVFYNTVRKRLSYYKNVLTKKNQMGKFWKVDELDEICEKLGVKGTYIEQPKELPYSRYRFDYLIKN